MRRHVLNPGGRRARAGAPGVVLVLTVLLVGLLLVMGLTMINLASSDYQVATNESRSIQALYNADSGTEEAKMRLSPNAPTANKITVNTAANWRVYILSGQTQAAIQAGLDPTYGWAPPNYATTESTTNYAFVNSIQTGGNAIPWGWARVQHKFNAAGAMVYQDALTGAEVTNATQTVGGNTVNNPAILAVTTEGIQGAVRRMISMELQPIVSTTTTTTTVVTDPFGNAAHGVGPIELTGGATTDSYDSRLGAYNVSGNKGSNGDISTDSTANGSVTLDAGSTVNGDVAVGPGGTAGAPTIQNSGTITGTLVEAPSTWNMPVSAIPAGVTNQGPLTISGTERTLTEGTYWFSSLKISGGGKLVISGAVKIYVTGNIDVTGNGLATAGNLPPNLLVYGTVDPNNSANKCERVDINGNGSIYAAIYAPTADIRVVGNAAVYGSLTGKSAFINGNGGLHYDEALADLGRQVTTTTTTTYTTTGFTRYSWREIPF